MRRSCTSRRMAGSETRLLEKSLILAGFAFPVPGSQGVVSGRGSDRSSGDRKKFALHEPSYGRLRGTLRDADGFGEVLIADLDGVAATLLLGSNPQIDEEGDGPAVVAHEVAQEDVGDVFVESQHRRVIMAIPFRSIAATT